MICRHVCKSWNELIEDIIKVRKLEEKIQENWYRGDPNFEGTSFNIHASQSLSNLLFIGKGISLISGMSQVTVVDESDIWILKTEGIISGQATEDIIIIERLNYDKECNTLEIWNRISKNRIGNIELEDPNKSGVYKCYKSTVFIYSKIKAQFSSVEVSTREEKIVEKISYYTPHFNPYLASDLWKDSVPESEMNIGMVEASPSQAVLKLYAKDLMTLVYFHIDKVERKITRKFDTASITYWLTKEILQLKIIDHFVITMVQSPNKWLSNMLKMTVYDQRRKGRKRVAKFWARIEPLSNSYSPENCLLDCQDGNLLFTMDTSRIYVFNLESLCRAYPEESYNCLQTTDNFDFQSKILEVDIKRPNNFYSPHIGVDKTSITILHYPMMPFLPAEIKKFNFWT